MKQHSSIGAKILDGSSSNKIIEEARGKHFDPEIAGAFLEEKNEVLKIAEKYRDDRSH